VIGVDELRVLRDIWSASGQDDIDCGDARSCKRMTDVGFEEMAQEYDGDLRAAWRATLKREGKLRSDGSG
jgi:hypothetical protein